MKKTLFIGATVLLAGSLLAAESSPKDDVMAATKKLGGQANYSWKTTVVVPESAQFKPGPSEGQTEKDGFTHLTLNFGDNTTQVIIKGDKRVVSDPDGGWQALADLDNAEGPRRSSINTGFPSPRSQSFSSFTSGSAPDSERPGGSEPVGDGVRAVLVFGRPFSCQRR